MNVTVLSFSCYLHSHPHCPTQWHYHFLGQHLVLSCPYIMVIFILFIRHVPNGGYLSIPGDTAAKLFTQNLASVVWDSESRSPSLMENEKNPTAMDTSQYTFRALHFSPSKGQSSFPFFIWSLWQGLAGDVEKDPLLEMYPKRKFQPRHRRRRKIVNHQMTPSCISGSNRGCLWGSRAIYTYIGIR